MWETHNLDLLSKPCLFGARSAAPWDPRIKNSIVSKKHALTFFPILVVAVGAGAAAAVGAAAGAAVARWDTALNHSKRR